MMLDKQISIVSVVKLLDGIVFLEKADLGAFKCLSRENLTV